MLIRPCYTCVCVWAQSTAAMVDAVRLRVKDTAEAIADLQEQQQEAAEQEAAKQEAASRSAAPEPPAPKPSPPPEAPKAAAVVQVAPKPTPAPEAPAPTKPATAPVKPAEPAAAPAAPAADAKPPAAVADVKLPSSTGGGLWGLFGFGGSAPTAPAGESAAAPSTKEAPPPVSEAPKPAVAAAPAAAPKAAPAPAPAPKPRAAEAPRPALPVAPALVAGVSIPGKTEPVLQQELRGLDLDGVVEANQQAAKLLGASKAEAAAREQRAQARLQVITDRGRTSADSVRLSLFTASG